MTDTIYKASWSYHKEEIEGSLIQLAINHNYMAFLICVVCAFCPNYFMQKFDKR